MHIFRTKIILGLTLAAVALGTVPYGDAAECTGCNDPFAEIQRFIRSNQSVLRFPTAEGPSIRVGLCYGRDRDQTLNAGFGMTAAQLDKMVKSFLSDSEGNLQIKNPHLPVVTMQGGQIVVANLKYRSKVKLWGVLDLGVTILAEPRFRLQPVHSKGAFGLKIVNYDFGARLYEAGGKPYKIDVLLNQFGAHAHRGKIRQFDTSINGAIKGQIGAVQSSIADSMSLAMSGLPLPSTTSADPRRLISVSHDDGKRTTWVKLNKGFFKSFGPEVSLKGFAAHGNTLRLTMGTQQTVDQMAQTGFTAKLDSHSLTGTIRAAVESIKLSMGVGVRIHQVAIGNDGVIRVRGGLYGSNAIVNGAVNSKFEIPLTVQTSATNRLIIRVPQNPGVIVKGAAIGMAGRIKAQIESNVLPGIQAAVSNQFMVANTFRANNHHLSVRINPKPVAGSPVTVNLLRVRAAAGKLSVFYQPDFRKVASYDQCRGVR